VIAEIIPVVIGALGALSPISLVTGYQVISYSVLQKSVLLETAGILRRTLKLLFGFDVL